MTTEPGPPFFQMFDPQRFVSMMSRAMQGPEQATRVYRELMGLEGGSRERAVDFMAQLARRYGMDATPMFEGVLRFHPSPTARVAAAAYLVEQDRDDTVLEVLESLQPPVLTITLLNGLLDALATRPASPERIARLVEFARRFEDNEHYTTLYLGDFTGRDVKRSVRRAIAESLLRRDAPDAAEWDR
ncbi:MAG: hypothetical protein HYX51_06345 [Chloroflexi bacterium]|nr:hypothetical protein [Chloroflexota bacterium]